MTFITTLPTRYGLRCSAEPAITSTGMRLHTHPFMLMETAPAEDSIALVLPSPQEVNCFPFGLSSCHYMTKRDREKSKPFGTSTGASSVLTGFCEVGETVNFKAPSEGPRLSNLKKEELP
jgi:hypothetical protein